MNETIQELRTICKKPNDPMAHALHVKVYRKISIYFTKSLLSIGFNANQTSILSICVLIPAGILLGTGEYIYLVLGSLLLQLRVIIDCADGEVARYSKSANPSGEYIEKITHQILSLIHI